jgi:hypothetical protein
VSECVCVRERHIGNTTLGGEGGGMSMRVKKLRKELAANEGANSHDPPNCDQPHTSPPPPTHTRHSHDPTNGDQPTAETKLKILCVGIRLLR